MFSAVRRSPTPYPCSSPRRRSVEQVVLPPPRRCAGAPFAFVRSTIIPRTPARVGGFPSSPTGDRRSCGDGVVGAVDKGMLDPEEGAAHRACGRCPSTPADTPSLALTRPAGAFGVHQVEVFRFRGRAPSARVAVMTPRTAAQLRLFPREGAGAGRKCRGRRAAHAARFSPRDAAAWQHPRAMLRPRTRASPADTCRRAARWGWGAESGVSGPSASGPIASGTHVGRGRVSPNTSFCASTHT